VAGTIFRTARLWDGVASSAIVDGFLRVDGETITAVGRWADLTASNAPTDRFDDATVIDCGDTTLLPGLVNSHVHMTLSGSTTVLEDYLAERALGVDALVARAVHNLGAAVRAGVTTVRDCGTLNEVAFRVRAAVASGGLVGPRVVTSGSPLTSPGGHCHFFSLEVDTADGLRRAVGDQALPSSTACSRPHAALPMIRRSSSASQRAASSSRPPSETRPICRPLKTKRFIRRIRTGCD
jgi:imidazolonepropionase-like amidohydrolase